MNDADKRITRREALKLSPVAIAGAAMFLESTRSRTLEAGLRLSDWVSQMTFSARRLAPTFADSEVTPVEAFPYNSYDVVDPEIDLDAWTLTVEGNVARPGEYGLDEIRRLPRIAQNTRHICIEGWDVIGAFGGARVSDFLDMVGADPSARYLEFYCADDYYSSIDMASARHPQSLLCYEMYGRPLDRGHGAPLRLQTPIKLGYKQVKYLTTLRVSRDLGARKGYWEDLGYSWHGGL